MARDWQFRIIGKEHARYPRQLACTHGCEYIIQVVAADTGEIEFEWCTLFAEQFAGELLNAVELSHLSS